MKRFLFLLSFFSVAIGCVTCTQTPKQPTVLNVVYTETPHVSLATDTIHIAVDGRLDKGKSYGNKYYLLYRYASEELNIYSRQKDYTYYFVEVDKNGEFPDIYGLDIPKNKYGRAILRDQEKVHPINDSVSIVMQINDTWVKSFAMSKPDIEPSSCIYEDEQFIITSEDHGEFGGMVYFRDKITDKLYGAISNSVVCINYFNDKYYVTNYLGHMGHRSDILEIANPRDLRELDGYIEDNVMWANENYRYATQGTKQLYESWDIELRTSFIHKGRLLHLFSDSDGTYLAEINNERLDTLYTFSETIEAYHCGRTESGNRLLIFWTEETEKSGYMEISDELIHMHYIINHAPDD